MSEPSLINLEDNAAAANERDHWTRLALASACEEEDAAASSPADASAPDHSAAEPAPAASGGAGWGLIQVHFWPTHIN